ncbi:MAG: hypothetical protein ACK52I_04125 [Pseudomonadota bacterium]
MGRGRLGRITWGAAFANTFDPAYPLDEARAYSVDRDGSATITTLTGVADAWIVGVDHLLSGRLRWLTTAQYDGTTGVRAMLEWLRAQNVGRWYPDRVSAPSTFIPVYLVASSEPEAEADFTRAIAITFRSSDGSPFTGY